MSGQRQAGVANAFDICLLGLGAELKRSGPQLLRSPFALAQLLLHGAGEPLIPLVQRRPRWSSHDLQSTGPEGLLRRTHPAESQAASGLCPSPGCGSDAQRVPETERSLFVLFAAIVSLINRVPRPDSCAHDPALGVVLVDLAQNAAYVVCDVPLGIIALERLEIADPPTMVADSVGGIELPRQLAPCDLLA